MSPDELRTWRQSRGLTQKQLAALAGVSVLTIKRWERGTNPVPKLLETYAAEHPERNTK